MARPFRSRRTVPLVVTIIAAIVGIAAGIVLLNAWQDRPPGEDSVEAGFLRDMQVHHTQAVEMAMIIRDRTDDEQIEAMAIDIAFTQTAELGMMQGALNMWDLNPTGSEPAMAWMGHPTDGLMMGMATPEEVDLLRTLPVDQAETLFLQLMNRHHIAGVEMAQAVLDRSDNDDIERMATAMIRTQNAEIEVMNTFITERGEEAVTPENAYSLDFLAGIPGATPAATPQQDHSGH